jgi:AcrR family transcriptional regulator
VVPTNADNTRDRLLRAAAELLDEAAGGDVSTRAVCERAGVAAPTLYHHFGSKNGLLRAVVEYGMGQYGSHDDGTGGEDPLAALRQGWDSHVSYGLANPSFYVLLYGRIDVGNPCAVTAVAERQLSERLGRLERDGLLRVPVGVAASRIVAANVGVTLYLIGRRDDDRDLALSDGLREMVLASVVHQPVTGVSGTQLADAATEMLRALASTNPSPLSDGERMLMTEWLSRLRV